VDRRDGEAYGGRGEHGGQSKPSRLTVSSGGGAAYSICSKHRGIFCFGGQGGL
jgi:hypothetical protein